LPKVISECANRCLQRYPEITFGNRSNSKRVCAAHLVEEFTAPRSASIFNREKWLHDRGRSAGGSSGDVRSGGRESGWETKARGLRAVERRSV